MKAFYWNIRGTANPDSQLTLMDFCVVHKPYEVFVAKPKISSAQILPCYWQRCDLKFVCGNDRGGEL